MFGESFSLKNLNSNTLKNSSWEFQRNIVPRHKEVCVTNTTPSYLVWLDDSIISVWFSLSLGLRLMTVSQWVHANFLASCVSSQEWTHPPPQEQRVGAWRLPKGAVMVFTTTTLLIKPRACQRACETTIFRNAVVRQTHWVMQGMFYINVQWLYRLNITQRLANRCSMRLLCAFFQNYFRGFFILFYFFGSSNKNPGKRKILLLLFSDDVT